jgi:hypothetical protein
VDAAVTFTVGDLARNEGPRLRCRCRARTLRRRELVGADARVHRIGLRQQLLCFACGEPPLEGQIARNNGSGR